MLWFRGFKASLNFGSGKSSGIEHYDKSPGVSINGAYRTNKDELFGSVHYVEPSKRITPPTVKMPTTHSRPSKSLSKSTTDVSKPSNQTVNIRKSVPNVSQVQNTQPTKTIMKDEKKLEKQRLAEQKKQEKLAEKERQREEKVRKEREKQVQETRVEQTRDNVKKPKKRAAPQPQQQKTAQKNIPTNTHSQSQKRQYSTNTLESSISKSSGPPPYSSVHNSTPNENDVTGNTSFAKPANGTESWDLISQHRQQMNKQTGVSKNIPKQTRLDLHYTVGTTRSKNTNTVAQAAQ